MKKFISVFLSVCGLLLTVFGGTAAQEADNCYRKDGYWNEDEQTCQLTAGIVVNINYPLELVGTGVAEERVNTFLREHQTEFFKAYAPDSSRPWFRNYWTLDINYQLFHFSSDIVSIVFQIDSDSSGGWHPATWFTTFTFDLKRQQELVLTDIFQEGVTPWPILAPLVQESLQADLLMEELDPIWVEEDGQWPETYRRWALTEDSLIIFFDRNEVASYLSGIPSASITLSTIRDILKPEFAPK